MLTVEKWLFLEFNDRSSKSLHSFCRLVFVLAVEGKMMCMMTIGELRHCVC